MYQEKLKTMKQNLKKSTSETANLLAQFKWYIFIYMIFYLNLFISYLIPSPKNYFIWNNESWYTYDKYIYLEVTKLILVIFFLLFLIGTSNMRNHPKIAKLIFLSSLWFGAIFVELI